MSHRFTLSEIIGVLLLITSGILLLTQDVLISALIPSPAAVRSNQSAMPAQLKSLRRAIIGQESGANFRAVNPHSGALGYAQVMPDNLPHWSKEALGYTVSRTEFLNDPDLQLRIIDYKLNQYWQQSQTASGGDEDLTVLRVAAWWYSGKPDLYTSTQAQFYQGYRYPSIAEYSLAVLQRYQILQTDT